MANNKDTAFTKMCITEAILDLMEHTPFEKIRVSDVIKRAGVARMTFYNHYDSIYSALKDYLQMIIKKYIESNSNEQAGSFLEYKHILFSLEFFHRYRNYFLTLANNNLHSIMLDAINQVLRDNLPLTDSSKIYAVYCYAGGLLNTFLKWEEGGCKEETSKIAELLFGLCHRTVESPV